MNKITNPITGKEYKVVKRTSKNKTNKGARIEREFIKVLENSGKFNEIWKPCKCRRGVKSKHTSNDIFGLFDIIALESEYIDTPLLHLFQIKANKSDYYKAKKRVKEFVDRYIYLDGYIVLRIKKGLWRIRHYHFDTFADGGLEEREYYINDKFEEVSKA